jgi:hypothetical protein
MLVDAINSRRLVGAKLHIVRSRFCGVSRPNHSRLFSSGFDHGDDRLSSANYLKNC